MSLRLTRLTVGLNIWPHVSIEDTGQLFMVVYNGALKGDIGPGESGYYFGTAGEYTLLGAAETIGQVLVERGISKSAEPVTLSPEELEKYCGGGDRPSTYGGSNCRAVSERSKSIGWKPRYTELEDFKRHLREEVGRVETRKR